MDTQTRHALKGDKFAQATKTSVTWLSGHRSNVMRWAIQLQWFWFWALDSGFLEYAECGSEHGPGRSHGYLFRAAGRCPAHRPQKGAYATAAERSKAANQQFQAVADKYRLAAGRRQRLEYFAGVTYQELGQTGPAETELKKATGSWDRNLANLAKIALASLYHQTGRDAQAIDLYNSLIAKPSETVSAGTAQLAPGRSLCCDRQAGSGARLWAKVKDSDKDGAAGSIAAQKLSGRQ